MLSIIYIALLFNNYACGFFTNNSSTPIITRVFDLGAKKSLINVKTKSNQKIKFSEEPKLTIPLTSESINKIKVSSRKRQEMPILFDHLSNRLIKLMYEKDLETFNEKKQQREKLNQWRIRPHPKRLAPILYRLGDEVLGRVAKIYPTYALVDVGSTCYGILHARDISDDWTPDVKSALKLGMDYRVVVTGIDEKGRSLRLTMRQGQIERVKKLVDAFKNLTLNESIISKNVIADTEASVDTSISTDVSSVADEKIKVKLHVPPCVSPFPYPYKIYKLENRKQPHEYQINEIVFGRVTRYTGMGCFVDIGATVDAFLHYKDARLLLPERKKRLDLKVGNYLDKLYIKHINAARNRIGVTFKTFEEDLEERVVSGKDTIEEQVGYPNTPLYNECLQNFANYVEFLKLSGLFDGFLKEIGGTRDSSLKYLAYLTNLHNQKLLKEDQMTLRVERFTPKRTSDGKPDPRFAYRKINIKTKKGRNEFKDRYNSLGDEILKLDSALIYPDKKSIYQTGEASVWNNEVSTPLNERTCKYYFGNLNEQIKHALDVVQGNSLDKIDVNWLDNQNLLDNFRMLKEIFETNLTNSVNTDDVLGRDNMALTEDIISLRMKHKQDLKLQNDDKVNPVEQILNEVTKKHDADSQDNSNIIIDNNTRKSISLDYADAQTKKYEEFRSKSLTPKLENSQTKNSSNLIRNKVRNEKDLDLKDLVDLTNKLDNLKPEQVLDLINSMEDVCAQEPELAAGLEQLKIVAKNAMQGNLTPPVQIKSEDINDNFLDETSQQLLSNAIAYNAKRPPGEKMNLELAKKALIPPDPTKYIPKGSEIEGCWCILQDLLKITRFNRMLDRFNISTEQPPEKLIREISRIVPNLVQKRIDMDRKLNFNYTEDHQEEISKIPL